MQQPLENFKNPNTVSSFLDLSRCHLGWNNRNVAVNVVVVTSALLKGQSSRVSSILKRNGLWWEIPDRKYQVLLSSSFLLLEQRASFPLWISRIQELEKQLQILKSGT